VSRFTFTAPTVRLTEATIEISAQGADRPSGYAEKTFVFETYAIRCPMVQMTGRIALSARGVYVPPLGRS
jgi:hypothetical protein